MHIIAVVILISLLGAQARVAPALTGVNPRADDGEAVSSKDLLSTNPVDNSVDDKEKDSKLLFVVPNGDAPAAPNADQNGDSDESDSSQSDKTTAAQTEAPTDPPTESPTEAPTDPPTKTPTKRPTSSPNPVLPTCTWFNWWLFTHCWRWKWDHIFG